MTNEFKKKNLEKDEIKKINNICEECNKNDESVPGNLIMYSYKICESCRISKNIFPI